MTNLDNRAGTAKQNVNDTWARRIACIRIEVRIRNLATMKQECYPHLIAIRIDRRYWFMVLPVQRCLMVLALRCFTKTLVYVLR